MLHLDFSQMMAALRDGEVSSQDLTRDSLERIGRVDASLHAFLHVAGQQAMEQARKADQRLAEWRQDQTKQLPALVGIPIAVKDVLCVAGLPCTSGSRILEGFVPPYTATVVEHLLHDGAVIVGKTNTDEFAMGSSTEFSAYGVTRNPWNYERVPGGSSGGSAAAVAARMVPLALGTDTGGSVRHPAAFCGVVGLKPTYGRVSRYGLVAFGSSLDVVGALGIHVRDVATAYQVIAGRDSRDATTLDIPVDKIEFHPSGSWPLAGLKVGVPQEYFISGMQAEVEAAVRSAIQELANLGAELIPVSLPHTEFAVPVYYLIAPAEASANLARYDGIRYGPRLSADTMWDVFRLTRGEKFGPEVKRRIMLGTYALSAGYYDAYYGQAQKVRTLIRRDFEQVFDNVDVIAAPVTPTTAFPIGEHSEDPLSMYLEDIFTLPASLAGIPALAFPVGFDAAGLPIGMQLMGPAFAEQRLLQMADAYQQVTDWHLQKPELEE